MSSPDRSLSPTERDRALLEAFLRGAWRRRWVVRGGPVVVILLLFFFAFSRTFPPLFSLWVVGSAVSVGRLVYLGLADRIRGPHFGPEAQLTSAATEESPDPETVRDIADRYRRHLSDRTGTQMTIMSREVVWLTDEVLEDSHALAALGPRSIPPLLEIVTEMRKEEMTTRVEMVQDLLRAIAAGTMERYRPDPARFLCGRCLVGLVERPLFDDPGRRLARIRPGTRKRYVTCPRCLDLVDVVPRGEGLVVVLDSGWSGAGRWREGEHLCVEWLRLRQPVDADAIRIVRAEDRDVEQLLIQLADRPDSEGSKRIPWSLSCDLDPNTVTMLESRLGPASAA